MSDIDTTKRGAQLGSSAIVRPVGLLTVIGARNRSDKRSEHAAWAEVIVSDEAGNEFVFDASAFGHSMKPNHPLIHGGPANE